MKARRVHDPRMALAYLRNPDGNKLACVCQHYSPQTDEYSKEQ